MKGSGDGTLRFTPVTVLVRMKPLEVERGKGLAGTPCAKQIVSFDATSITTNADPFSFPSRVYAPDLPQEEIYATLMPSFVR